MVKIIFGDRGDVRNDFRYNMEGVYIFNFFAFSSAFHFVFWFALVARSGKQNKLYIFQYNSLVRAVCS